MSLPSFESPPGGSSDGPFGSAFSVRSPSVTSHHGAVSCPVGGLRGSALKVCWPKCPRRVAVPWCARSRPFWQCLTCLHVRSPFVALNRSTALFPVGRPFTRALYMRSPFVALHRSTSSCPVSGHFSSALHVHSPLSHLAVAAYCARSGHALVSPASSCDTCHTRTCLHPKHCVELASVTEGATTVKPDASERWAEGKDGGGLQGGTGAGMLVSDWMLEAPQPQKDVVGCRRGRGFDAPGCRCGCDIEGPGDD